MPAGLLKVFPEYTARELLTHIFMNHPDALSARDIALAKQSAFERGIGPDVADQRLAIYTRTMESQMKAVVPEIDADEPHLIG